MRKNNQVPPRLNINPDTLPNCVCVCGSIHFFPALIVKKISAILSPDGRDQYFSMQVNICAKCHTALPDHPALQEAT